MLKLAKYRIVKKVPVTVNVPADGGEIQKRKVHVDFKLHDRADQQAIEKDDDGTPEKDWMIGCIAGWPEGEFEMESGDPLAFTPENLVTVLGISYVRAALVQRYVELSAGMEARRKN